MSKILVVDDSYAELQVIEGYLKGASHTVVSFPNTEKLEDKVIAEKPDLILMDIQLPVLDGYEATRRIKAEPTLRDVPIIAVTSYALAGDEAKARAAGCDAYISKPFSPRQLLAKVRELLP